MPFPRFSLFDSISLQALSIERIVRLAAMIVIVAPLTVPHARVAAVMRHDRPSSSNRMLAQVHVGEHAGMVGAALGPS
jgi:hypothetical protein